MAIADVKAAKGIKSNTLWWKRIVQKGFLQDCICKQLWQNCFFARFRYSYTSSGHDPLDNQFPDQLAKERTEPH